MRKIVFVRDLAEHYLDKVQSIVPDWEVIAGKDPEIWRHHLVDAEIIGGWNPIIQTECLNNPSAKLRWLHNWGAGVDNLPLDGFKRKHVILTNSSGVHAYPISETILGMMLAFARRLDLYIRKQMKSEWTSIAPTAEIHGKTVGILGVGAIGLETARLCKAFGMRVLGLRRSGQAAEYVDHMYKFEELADLLAESDFIVNTLPSTIETRNRIGQAEFACMKPTSFYINIGRGDTNDEEALVRALRDGQIAGAGLDVFREEPLPYNSPFWSMDNVILTPHTSGSTGEYDDRVLELFLPNLQAYKIGDEPMLNRVNLDLQY